MNNFENYKRGFMYMQFLIFLGLVLLSGVSNANECDLQTLKLVLERAHSKMSIISNASSRDRDNSLFAYGGAITSALENALYSIDVCRRGHNANEATVIKLSIVSPNCKFVEVGSAVQILGEEFLDEKPANRVMILHNTSENFFWRGEMGCIGNIYKENLQK